MNFQHTLKSAIALKGIGLHSGKEVQMVVRPARANHGIVFIRTDLEGSPRVAAHHKNVVNTQLATTLGRGTLTISTVEHILAALLGMEIDNAVIEVAGPEVPILDGSSAPYVEMIRAVGTVAQAMIRPQLMLRRKVEVKVAEKWAMAEPSARLEVHGSIEWDHPAIGYQEYHYIQGRTAFEEIAAARTFCLYRDVENMKKMGLIRGGSLDNAVVLDSAAVLNPEGLRYPDELVRHKVLDALGDFVLAGVAIQAYVRMHRAGHELHSRLLAEIFSSPDNYEIVDGGREHEALSLPRLGALARRLVASVS